MSNKAIINKLNEQIQDFKDNAYSDDDKLRDWVDKTKIYILGISLDKKDESFKKEVIKMLEKYKEEIPTYNDLIFCADKEKAAIAIGKDVLRMQYKLKNVLESFVEIMELKEEDNSWDKKNNGIKVNIISYADEKIDIKKVMNNALNDIERENKTKKEKEEAKENLNKLEKELEESWLENRKVIKWLMKRFADFSQDVFVTLLPAIRKYNVEDNSWNKVNDK